MFFWLSIGLALIKSREIAGGLSKLSENDEFGLVILLSIIVGVTAMPITDWIEARTKSFFLWCRRKNSSEKI